jgi:hypothetical protein
VHPPNSWLHQAAGAFVGSGHSLASTTVFRSKPLPSGASGALPSRAANTRPDRIRSAGALICFAMASLMSAALRQGADSHKFLNCTPNKKIRTVKKNRKENYVLCRRIFLLQIDIIKK